MTHSDAVAVAVGNQVPASAVVIRRGLTVRQTERLVAELLEQPEDARATWIARRLASAPVTPAPRSARMPRSDTDGMMTDVATLLRVGARLQARLLGTPLGALGAPATELVLDGLGALAPVLRSLARTVATVLGQEQAA